jgi:chromosome segregation ATPase
LSEGTGNSAAMIAQSDALRAQVLTLERSLDNEKKATSKAQDRLKQGSKSLTYQLIIASTIDVMNLFCVAIVAEEKEVTIRSLREQKDAIFKQMEQEVNVAQRQATAAETIAKGATEQMSSMTREMITLTEAKTQAMNTATQAERKVNEWQTKVETLTKEYALMTSNHESQLNDVHRALETSRASSEQHAAMVKSIGEVKDGLERDVTVLRHELQTIQEREVAAQAQVVTLEQRHKAAVVASETARGDTTAVEKKYNDEKAAWLNQLQRAEQASKEMADAANEADDESARLRDELTTITTRADDDRKRVTELENQLTTTTKGHQAMVDDLHIQVADAHATIEQLKKTIADGAQQQQGRSSMSEEETNQLRAAATEVESLRASLLEQKRDRTTESQTLRGELTAATARAAATADALIDAKKVLTQRDEVVAQLTSDNKRLTSQWNDEKKKYDDIVERARADVAEQKKRNDDIVATSSTNATVVRDQKKRITDLEHDGEVAAASVAELRAEVTRHSQRCNQLVEDARKATERHAAIESKWRAEKEEGAELVRLLSEQKDVIGRAMDQEVAKLKQLSSDKENEAMEWRNKYGSERAVWERLRHEYEEGKTRWAETAANLHRTLEQHAKEANDAKQNEDEARTRMNQLEAELSAAKAGASNASAANEERDRLMKRVTDSEASIRRQREESGTLLQSKDDTIRMMMEAEQVSRKSHQDLVEQKATLEKTLDQLQKAAASQRQDHAALQQRCAQLEDMIRSSSATASANAASDTELKALRTRMSEIEESDKQHRTLIEQQHGKITARDNALLKLKNAFEQLQSTLEEEKKRSAALAMSVAAGATAVSADISSERQRWNDEKVQWTTTLSVMERQVSDERERADLSARREAALQKATERLTDDVKKLRVEANEAQIHYDNIQTRVLQLETEMKASSAALNAVTSERDNAHERVRTLEAASAAAEREKTTAADEIHRRTVTENKGLVAALAELKKRCEALEEDNRGMVEMLDGDTVVELNKTLKTKVRVLTGMCTLNHSHSLLRYHSSFQS